jgi:hypothetical protein
MGQISLPERGQPIDLSYLYKIVNSINELYTQISSSQYNYITIDTPANQRQTAKTSESKVVGGILPVTSDTTYNAGQEQTFSYDFPGNFKYPPVVTATPVNIGGTPAGRDVSVVIKSISNSRVDVVVRFRSSGVSSVVVNLIAVGIPN